jgi:hypothetical protein
MDAFQSSRSTSARSRSTDACRRLAHIYQLLPRRRGPSGSAPRAFSRRHSLSNGPLTIEVVPGSLAGPRPEARSNPFDPSRASADAVAPSPGIDADDVS